MAFGQTLPRWEVPVSVSSMELPSPFVGGLNTPEFSPIFLNSDTLSDLFIFDRSGDKVLTFIAVPGGQQYEYAPEYESIFPEMIDWVLLRDYNGDSLMDIFTASTTGVPGIDVYTANKTDGVISFQRFEFKNPVGVAGYPTSSGIITNVYVATGDVPAIDDIDGDGDLDILTFQSDGTKLYYYSNTSMEDGDERDSLHFSLEDKCWGKIAESFNTNAVILSSDSLICPLSANQNARLHGGSTVMTFDPDKDGDKDVILGDFSYETILFLENGGSASQSWVTSQTADFPSAMERVEVEYFPATFYFDVDHDGVNDLIVSPNQEDSRENVSLSWFYKGEQDENGAESFNFSSNVFIVDQMLDFGTDASPLFFDYDRDGLLDLLVGSRFHQGYLSDAPSQLFLFRNMGSMDDPSFALVDSNWLTLTAISDEIDALTPTVADMDRDGDLDLIIGNKRGKLMYIENVAVEAGPFEMGDVLYPWFDIDVGFSSVPTLVDLDEDGDLDLLVGEEKGNVNYFTNTGTKEVPVFKADETDPDNFLNFGGIDARQDNAVFGMAAPTTFNAGDTSILLVGTAHGNLLFYDLKDVRSDDILVEIAAHPIARGSSGARSKIAIADLDLDGYLDLMVGTSRGGLSLFKTTFRSDEVVSDFVLNEESTIELYPNPGRDKLVLNLNARGQKEVLVIDVKGIAQLKYQGTDQRLEFDVSDLTAGLYYVSIRNSNRTIIRAWIKQ